MVKRNKQPEKAHCITVGERVHRAMRAVRDRHGLTMTAIARLAVVAWLRENYPQYKIDDDESRA